MMYVCMCIGIISYPTEIITVPIYSYRRELDNITMESSPIIISNDDDDDDNDDDGGGGGDDDDNNGSDDDGGGEYIDGCVNVTVAERT